MTEVQPAECNDSQNSNSNAVQVAQELPETAALDAIERVIVLNYLHCNRPQLVAKTDDVQLIAQSWLPMLYGIPNVNVDENGETMHMIDLVYRHYLVTTATRHPMALNDMLEAWKSLQSRWYQRAYSYQTPVKGTDWKEYGDDPLKPRPLDEDELERRREICRQTRERFGFPAYGERVPEPRPEPTGDPGLADSLRKVQRHIGRAPQPADQAEPQGVGITTRAAVVKRETVEQLSVRLADECAQLVATPVEYARLTSFNREFWEQNHRAVESAELLALFPDYSARLQQRFAKQQAAQSELAQR